jgi:hypothetical protein
MTILVILTIAGTIRTNAQGFDAQQLLLDVEKLGQLKQILQDLKNGYQVLQSGYSAIRDIAKNSFDLHKSYLDGLLAVSPTVQGYERIAVIADMQVRLIQSYQSAWNRFQYDKNLQPVELAALSQLYTQVLKASADDLDDLTDGITAGTIRASDAERLQGIDLIYHRAQTKLSLIQRVNNETSLLSLQRAGEATDISVLRQWFGITP